jgi:hypothetical protein
LGKGKRRAGRKYKEVSFIISDSRAETSIRRLRKRNRETPRACQLINAAASQFYHFAETLLRSSIMSFSPSMKLRRRRYILTLVFVVPTISYSKARFDFLIALALAKNLWARTITTAISSSFRAVCSSRVGNHRVNKLLRTQREGEIDQNELSRLFHIHCQLLIPKFGFNGKD